MGYTFPVGDIYVPADWFNHCCERTPPSSEPGTDYASGYGTPVAAPAAGTVIDVKTTSSSATGRYVTIAFDDGRTDRQLHLSAVYVQIGYRVTAGAIVAASGASGYGSDWYYGSHLHQTLWPGTAWASQTIDFENYVGTTPPAPTPEPEPEPLPIMEDEPMLLIAKEDGTVYTIARRYLHHVSNGDEANICANLYNTGVIWRKQSNGRIVLPDSFFDKLLSANGVPQQAQKDVVGGKTWWDGVLYDKYQNPPASSVAHADDAGAAA